MHAPQAHAFAQAYSTGANHKPQTMHTADHVHSVQPNPTQHPTPHLTYGWPRPEAGNEAKPWVAFNPKTWNPTTAVHTIQHNRISCGATHTVTHCLVVAPTPVPMNT